MGLDHLAGDEIEGDEGEHAERDQGRPDVVGRAAVGVQREDASGDQPERSQRREHTAGGEQQLADEQGDADQSDDDGCVH